VLGIETTFAIISIFGSLIIDVVVLIATIWGVFSKIVNFFLNEWLYKECSV
jgi:5-bromo-4-chloroindolyl phosphate hydrolysis protein